MSVEHNKIVAKRFFEEVFNNKKVEFLDELVASDVVDHKRSYSPNRKDLEVWEKVSACSLSPSRTCTPP